MFASLDLLPLLRAARSESWVLGGWRPPGLVTGDLPDRGDKRRAWQTASRKQKCAFSLHWGTPGSKTSIFSHIPVLASLTPRRDFGPGRTSRCCHIQLWAGANSPALDELKIHFQPALHPKVLRMQLLLPASSLAQRLARSQQAGEGARPAAAGGTRTAPTCPARGQSPEGIPAAPARGREWSLVTHLTPLLTPR